MDDPCPICYSKISIPIRVPACGHQFCFCCLKGVCLSYGEPLCPMCRGEIDKSIFDGASMQGLSLTLAADKSIEDEFKEPEDIDRPKKFWIYSGGRNNWWRFEPRDEEDINKAFLKGDPVVELSICGQIYISRQPNIINFVTMEQYRKANEKMKRKIKQVTEEELELMNVQGIAGMRCT